MSAKESEDKTEAKAGYLMARIAVHDKEAFAEFGKCAGPAIKQHGGKVLIRNPSPDVRENVQGAKGLLIVVQFPSLADAVKFYESEEYGKAMAIRKMCSDCDLILTEGVAPMSMEAGPADAGDAGAGGDAAAPVKKGYLVARVKINDAEGIKGYYQAAGPCIMKYGVKILANCVTPDVRETAQGKMAGKLVLGEFESYAAAKTFYESEEYTKAI